MEDEELIDELAGRLAERKGKAPVSLSDKLVVTELGFSVGVEENEEVLRRHFDASRLMRDHPRLVRLVEWLIGLGYVDWDVIADQAGMTWMTVAAIARNRKESVKEFKGRNAQNLRLVIEAAMPHMIQRAKDGKLTELGMKLMHDCYLLIAEQATSIVGTAERVVDPEEVALLRMLEMPSQHALGMGSEIGKLSAMREAVPAVIDGGTGRPVDI